MSIGSIFSSLFTSIKTTEETVLLPALGTAILNVAENPTEPNLIAQGVILLDTAIANALKSGGALSPIVSDISGALVTVAQGYVSRQTAKLAPKTAA